MSFKDRILTKRRHPVEITLDGVSVTIFVRPVTLEDLLPYTDRLPSAFVSIAGIEQARNEKRDLTNSEQMSTIELMRIFISCGVVGVKEGDAEPETLRIAFEAGPADFAMEDLEETGGGEDPEAYPNSQRVFREIIEISDLGSIFRRLAAAASLVEAAGGSGSDVGRAGEEVQDGPVDDLESVEPGPVRLQQERLVGSPQE